MLRCSSTPRLSALLTPFPGPLVATSKSFGFFLFFFFHPGHFSDLFAISLEAAYTGDGEEGGDALPLLEKRHGVYYPHHQQLHCFPAPASAAAPTISGLVQGSDAHGGFKKVPIFTSSSTTDTLSSNSEPPFLIIRCGGEKGLFKYR